ncbi:MULTISPECIES: phosphonate metabolism transcriptional regulator PhnF [unclassified Rhizobium]|jgi:GntR family phosphonate transport system transcriptional regulator|uniref:phosphonate metabolism transcriptional regulator PhnF n=1 Tax=unclassified Rhizobium TaxID=2613769 RepID=UPI00064927CB|nr:MULTISPECIES: phosphonate metabolism transcriptional regulator PhnF [unclassified Rhizobium]MBN8950385.1 phosphonate metabolism transcriptional regulator PhnF [Rhizobium tropici]OJY68917.1 MAG: phosphonate metabolism transcriptional regulator PhnF [Rhizobium sp. 60-20]RKD74315.1 GntR family transcriptional regulator [Rhizobium sp. WW_1]
MDEKNRQGEGIKTAGGWATVAAALRRAIDGGQHPPGSRLPSERALSEQFGVSRVTMRRAIAELEGEGLLRVARGSGAYVRADMPVRFQLGDKVRFSKDLTATDAHLTRKVLSAREVPATADIAARLNLQPGEAVLDMCVVAYADALPVSVVMRSCAAQRFLGLAEKFAVTGSFTAALKDYGVMDYWRRSTDITARMPTEAEARMLQQSRLAPVLAYAGEDIDADGTIISCQIGCFASERVVVTV